MGTTRRIRDGSKRSVSVVTVIFVEGDTDLYFFQDILVALKNTQTVTPHDCKEARNVYYFYDRRQRRVIINSSKQKKVIVRSSKDDYVILISCNNKKNTINTFIKSINEFLSYDNPVSKLFLIVDQDFAQGFVDQISDRICTLETQFPTEHIHINPFQSSDSLYKTIISRRSKKIQLGFTEVKPSLEFILVRFLRFYSDIPKSYLEGTQHEIIRKAYKYLNMNGTKELLTHLTQKYKMQLETEMTRAELKQPICYMVSDRHSNPITAQQNQA